MRRGESRGVELLSLLLGAVDPTKPRAELRLHSFSASAASSGSWGANKLSSSGLSNTASSSRALGCSSDAVPAMQFGERGKRHSPTMGDIGGSDRRAVHLLALASFPAGERSAQVSQLRA